MMNATTATIRGLRHDALVPPSYGKSRSNIRPFYPLSEESSTAMRRMRIQSRQEQMRSGILRTRGSS